jgi:hypothetical protein
MTYTQDPYSRFEEAYRSALRQMRRKKPKDEKIFALASTEEACENSGAVEFTPDWLEPFVSLAGSGALHDAGLHLNGTGIAEQRFLAALAPAIAHAARLGYVEGYFAGKDDD